MRENEKKVKLKYEQTINKSASLEGITKKSSHAGPQC
jgi:hypothetical protein